MTVQRYDVAVVGVGIVGASAVHVLARAGARVIALDSAAPGGGTSGTSFAWVNAVRKEPEVYHRLNAAGMAMHRELARELGEDGGYHEHGSLEWADGSDHERELGARVERLAARGYRAAWIDADHARRLEPGLRIPHHVTKVAFYADDGWLDVPRTIATLLAAATKAGADIRSHTRVRSLRRGGDRLEAVVTDAGEFAAGAVLSCVGPATRAFLDPLGVSLPVDRVPGLLAVTSAPTEPLGRVVHAPDVHLRPDASGGLLLGAADVDRLVTDTTPPEAAAKIAATLVERAARVFPPARGVRLVDSRIGVRPMPGDGQTIAGRLPGFANAWVLATHSGVTLGPLLGRLLAGEIVGGAPSATLAPFRPDRFAAAAAR